MRADTIIELLRKHDLIPSPISEEYYHDLHELRRYIQTNNERMLLADFRQNHILNSIKAKVETMTLIINETKEEIKFDEDFSWLFKGMYTNLPSSSTRECFLEFQRKLRNEVIKKWKPKMI